jgi:transposase-like protein
MSKKKRFPAETKASILKQHLQKKQPISELCQTHGCSPGTVYQWQETLFARAHMVFENGGRAVGRPRDQAAAAKKAEQLEEKLAAKNAIIAELMEELLREKKLAGVI